MTNNNMYFIANWKMFGSVKSVNSLYKVISCSDLQICQLINEQMERLYLFSNKSSLHTSARANERFGTVPSPSFSLNEVDIIQKIDRLAKRNKYGTVDGTQMNAKTARQIIAIYNHPKMNSHLNLELRNLYLIL